LFARFRYLALAFSQILTAVCTCLLPYSSSLLGMYSIAFVWGIGTGSLDTGGNVQMLDIWTGRDSGPYMHALSFVWSVGAVLAPLVAMPFLKNVPEEMLHPSINTSTPLSQYELSGWNETTKSNSTEDIGDDIWSVKTLFPLVGLVTGLVAVLFIYYFLRDAMKRRGNADIAHQISESVAKESLFLFLWWYFQWLRWGLSGSVCA
jgi:fucose permease